MIIKRKRIKARGPALQRALRHLADGEDNERVELLHGNVRDLQDARDDALRFGREYAVRHWILSPEKLITDEQVSELVDRLAVEFGFDPKQAVIWRHTKGRATDAACDQHYHLCVAEVDPTTGGVMSSSHDYARQTKIARAVEVAWGHTVTPSPHATSIVAALEREGDAKTAAAVRDLAPPDHAASFGEADHQRLKRAGFDLPRLRQMVAEALGESKSLAEFDSKLARLGFRLRTGDRKEIPIVETADGTVLGSLARLTGLRKAALEQRMTFHERRQSTPSEHPSGDVQTLATAHAADGAGRAARAGSGGARPAKPDGHDDRPDAANGGWDRAASRPSGAAGGPSGRPDGGQGDQGRDKWLKLSIGLAGHRDALLDLLNEARRAALPPLERSVGDLDGIIERETAACRVSELTEPASLLASRKTLEEQTARLHAAEADANVALQQLVECPSRSVWQRLLGPAIDPERQVRENRLEHAQRQLLYAQTHHTRARHALTDEQRKFQADQARHQAGLIERKAQAETRIATAQVARRFVERNPRSASWGADYLMRIAASIQNARTERQLSAESNLPLDWDLVPVLDLWGKPYLPPPRA
ncbi:relaxase/mobilization nuclease domain-containing protein [Bradyrhizobium sp. SZCCHNR2026]|uniref:relaxase/mobilization nuclease domain-containing protein n=1 Tax=Bradyrhizobium sp. SZCCHNR2026 TaxID=3057381 RepID=UPI002915FAB7|nr:hypothetical protein [Bradyrhizobium sp. SZCCHNR2026]